jgi:GDP-4-dehydro-6-deoxy-D-mannose reductase
MKKYIITGFSGFVSRHFIEHLEKSNPGAEILGIDMESPTFSADDFTNIDFTFEKVNLLDDERVENIIYRFQPDYILHLASFSSVGFSWKEPILSFRNNTNIFLNLLEAVRKLGLRCRILSVGSSEEYGNVREDLLPLKEEYELHPVSPYGVARSSQEQLSRVYAQGYNLDIVMTRSFNHVGPRQKDIFVIPSFAHQIALMKEEGGTEGLLRTGDVSVVRDFLDVRDVVRAYSSLFEKGKSGEVYNICSGKGHSLKEIIDMMAGIVGVNVKIEVDQTLLRPSDNRIVFGDNEKLKITTGWEQQFSLEQSLTDIIEYWKGRQHSL